MFKVIDGGKTVSFEKSHDVVMYFIRNGHGLPPMDESGNVGQTRILNFKEYQEAQKHEGMREWP